MSIHRVSATTPHWKYDIYLSFNSEDTQNNFTDHLYTNLKRRGITVFRGRNALELESQVIEESRFLIVIFSRNYAYNIQCLEELVKIVDHMKIRRQTVIPIFYHVDPSNVRKQEGDFQEAFDKYEETFKDNIEKVHSWRKALTELANISGWLSTERRESELIADVVEDISKRLHASGSRFMNLMMIASGLKSSLEKLRMRADANLLRLRWGPLAAITENPFFFFL